MDKSINTRIDGRSLKLSNLVKILYPGIGATKAEVIQYYMDIAPLFLKYIKNRPLTLIRFPDGIDQHQFYSKNRPDWSPDWIPGFSIQHSEETLDYIVAKEHAAVIWLANLAALEIHPMQFTIDKPRLADHMIFDLDPEEGQHFETLKQVAILLRKFLEGYGYTPFIKTSGSKGLHIYIPLVPDSSHEEMAECSKTLASLFVSQNSDTCTLELSKEKRKGKILIDIFRNHKSHTTVAPYSLRGKSGAPVSFPVLWEELDEITGSKYFHIRNYKSRLQTRGDAWKEFFENRGTLHTKREKRINPETTTVRLAEYINKRDFTLSPEPIPDKEESTGNRFSIQFHDASNLHYDLRLEDNDVLLSWAIPKGLPYSLGSKHLAIQTENHPLEYLDFEGVIPKGQYGAGQMWVYTKGTFKWIKREENKLNFELISERYNRTFRMFRTNKEQWLIELLENKDFSRVKLPVSPMLANSRKTLPVGQNFIYEVKWDGIRSIIHLEKDNLRIYSRNGRDITSSFPELKLPKAFDVESAILDGEIVSLDDKGVPVFSQVISRMHQKASSKPIGAIPKYQVVCYLFDCLFLDGKYIDNEPLNRRKSWLHSSLRKNNFYRYSESIKDGKELFDAGRLLGLEGVMAKEIKGTYRPGSRSDNWLKVKYRSKTECLIAGFTKGEGDREALFGALHLLEVSDEGKNTYRGKVGTGFDVKMMLKLLKKFNKITISEKPFETKTEDDNKSIWLNPVLRCEIEYASLSSNDTFREPVFIKLIK